MSGETAVEPARQPVVARRAGPGDVAALMRLRGLMLADMGLVDSPDEGAWREPALAWFTRRLADRDEFAAFVVDDPELGVVSSAVGSCDHHAPLPTNPSGRYGYVSNVSTDPRRQRRGHARACLDALLRWYATETPVRVVNLHVRRTGSACTRAAASRPRPTPSSRPGCPASREGGAGAVYACRP